MFTNNTERLVWLMGVLGLALVLKTCDADAAPILPLKPPKTVMAAIKHAAKVYGVDERTMIAIAYIESSFRPDAYNVNVNGTVDLGLFQINSVVAKEECEEYNLWSAKGSALCAAKMIAKHKKTGDPLYIGRYHNSRPELKLKYYRRVQEVK